MINFRSKSFSYSDSCVCFVHEAGQFRQTWDIVDGDGEDEQKNSSPAALCPPNLFHLFTSSFLSIWNAWMSSSSPLIHISILYFICKTKKKKKKIGTYIEPARFNFCKRFFLFLLLMDSHDSNYSSFLTGQFGKAVTHCVNPFEENILWMTKCELCHKNNRKWQMFRFSHCA